MKEFERGGPAWLRRCLLVKMVLVNYRGGQLPLYSNHPTQRELNSKVGPISFLDDLIFRLSSFISPCTKFLLHIPLHPPFPRPPPHPLFFRSVYNYLSTQGACQHSTIFISPLRGFYFNFISGSTLEKRGKGGGNHLGDPDFNCITTCDFSNIIMCFWGPFC
jgi:hypothetical protein